MACSWRAGVVPLLRRHASKAVDDRAAEIIVDRFEHLRSAYTSPKHPIVLCHGLSGFDRLTLVPRPHWGRPTTTNPVLGLVYFDYWAGILDVLTKYGSTVLTARVPPFGTVAHRAHQLHRFIDHHTASLDTGAKVKVNLVAHLMGGLDLRYLISRLAPLARHYEVASLTTILTPHRGSPVADYVARLPLFLVNHVVPVSIRTLTTGYTQRFNQLVEDDPAVAYFSYGARFVPSWHSVFLWPWYVCRRAGDNDGMVPVLLARWGQYLGTLEGVDHLDLINWSNKLRAEYHRVVLGKQAPFNPLALYLDIAEQLSKKGF